MAVAVFPAAVTTVDDAVCVVIFGMMLQLSEQGNSPQRSALVSPSGSQAIAAPTTRMMRMNYVAEFWKNLTAFGSTVTAPVRTSARKATWSLPKAYSLLRSKRMPPAMRTFSADISPK